jgi:hypothetical protein
MAHSLLPLTFVCPSSSCVVVLPQAAGRGVGVGGGGGVVVDDVAAGLVDFKFSCHVLPQRDS